MAKLRLAPGVWTNVGSITLSGAGAVTGASAAQIWLKGIGWIGMIFGLGILLWGIRINNKHIWQRWWRSFPSDETNIAQLSPAKTIAAKAVADLNLVEARLKYVDRLLSDKTGADLKKWRAKLDFQRVRLDGLRSANLRELTHEQAIKLEITLRKSDELEMTINALARGEGYNSLAHAAGMYRHRANEMRKSLQELIADLDCRNHRELGPDRGQLPS